jgi:hypothetical protein
MGHPEGADIFPSLPRASSPAPRAVLGEAGRPSRPGCARQRIRSAPRSVRWLDPLPLAALLLAALGWLAGGRASGETPGVAITEFMASNSGFLRDADGDSPDWIEICNRSAAPVNLAGWSLTDDADRLREWIFPATNLAANACLIVFASGKDRAVAGAELHASFQLRASGQYLALVDPHTNIVTQFAPAFPPQVANVSYGFASLTPPRAFITNGSLLRYWVPLDDTLGTNWVWPSFNDSAWLAGTNSIGYETAPGDYAGLFQTSVQAGMYNRASSCLIRIPFVVDKPADFTEWKLRLQTDDGAVVWLNGEEVLRWFAPEDLHWNSLATTNRADGEVLAGEVFNLAEFVPRLVAGTNWLAIHALNSGLNSSDLLIAPGLEAKSAAQLAAAACYFTAPTPGTPNGAGVVAPGPILADLAHTPALPDGQEDLVVTVNARPAFNPVASVTLHYRVMFTNEVAVPMWDDGAHGDGAAGDGRFGAVIPARAALPGQMIRYYVTAQDSAGRASRWPLFLDPLASSAYQGTMVRNNPVTALPVLHWFVQNPAAADTATGTRCALFFDGELYDNAFVRIRGQTSRGWPKKSYKFELNDDHHFRFRPDAPRVSEFNVNGTYTDKSFLRYQLADEHKRAAGLPCMESFHLRLHQNAQFFSLALFVEQVDRDFLRRQGLPDTGALYKGNQSAFAVNPSLYEKKTRQNESYADLQAFFTGLQLNGQALENFLFDNVEVAEVVNYMATVAITQDIDATDKNHFFYRDTEGTRLWRILPWDLDLTFGPNALNTDVIVYSQQSPSPPIYTSHPFIGARPYTLSPGKYNRLLEAIAFTPRTQQMLLRRIRTLADQFLASGFFTNRINALVPLLQPEVDLDHARWQGNAHFPGNTYTLRQAADRIIKEYLVPRLPFLTGSGILAVGAANPGSQPPLVAIGFAGVEASPASGNPDHEYLCLTNANPFAVDLTGWKVDGGVEFEFPPGTVIPAAGALYLSPNLAGFQARATGPRGGQGLFVQSSYRGRLSAHDGLVRLVNDFGRPIASLGYSAAPSPARQFLRVTELMWQPAPPPAGSASRAGDFEFIELRNTSPTQALDLTGVRFTDGVQFAFSGSAITNLAPGARVLVVASRAAFASRYGPSLPVAGEYAGQLGNSGERLCLLDARGGEILNFSYDPGWYPVTAGHGFSLVVVHDTAPSDNWGRAAHWRVSAQVNGSPGAPDPAPPAIPPVLVNEVLSASVPAGGDAIELFNPTAVSADLGGWWLSDDFRQPGKFRIPPGTVLAPGGFVVFTEADFNAGGLGFALDPDGDGTWLFSASATGALTGYAHGFDFGAAEPGVSFGRHLTSRGGTVFVAQSTNTLSAGNAPPRVGPVVLAEIMFHPPGLPPLPAAGPLLPDPGNVRDEFIELLNLASTNVPLAGWRLRGSVDFDFPAGAALAPGARLLVVGFDPASATNELAGFRGVYGPGAGVSLLGPWTGKLSPSARKVELLRPVLRGAHLSHPLVDWVDYSQAALWPGVDGDGASLQRLAPAACASDPASWAAAVPSPGGAPAVAAPPAITRQPADTVVVAGASASLEMRASGSEPLRYQWRRNGGLLAGATNATLRVDHALPRQYGLYQAVAFNPAGSVASATALLNVVIPPVIVLQPQSLSLAAGSDAAFTVSASGAGPLRYQWFKDGSALPAATNGVLGLAHVQFASAGIYTVAVTGGFGSATSEPAVLAVWAPEPPSFTQPPRPAWQEVLEGRAIRVTVAAAGSGPLSCQWFHNGLAVFAQTNETLWIARAAPTDAGDYTAVMANRFGAATSAVAVVAYQADFDHDGMADSWERQFGFATNNVGDALLDLDGDGLSNWQEYLAGTAPNDALSVPRLEISRASNGIWIGFQLASNRTCTIQSLERWGAANWSNFAWIPAQSLPLHTNLLDATTGSNRFYRLLIPGLP